MEYPTFDEIREAGYMQCYWWLERLPNMETYEQVLKIVNINIRYLELQEEEIFDG